MDRRTKGKQFEQLAQQYLCQQGLTLLDTQARFVCGELDLVMQHHDCIVFVEVRFRQNNHFGGAIASISQSKQQKLLKAGYLWLAAQGMPASHTQFRFDAVTFDGDLHTINWIQNIIVET
ncbi:MAG: YraN family protein [Enterovibrio sp.]